MFFFVKSKLHATTNRLKNSRFVFREMGRRSYNILIFNFFITTVFLSGGERHFRDSYFLENARETLNFLKFDFIK